MAAPLGPPQSSEVPKSVRSTIDLSAPPASIDDIAKRFDIVLASEDAPPAVAPVALAPPAELPAAEPTEPVAPEVEVDPNALDPATPKESAEPSEGETGAIRSVAQLAKYHQVEESELLDSIHITTADDNEIPLSTVIAGYLAQPEAAQVAEERGGLEDQFTQRRTELEGIHDEALLRVGHLAKVMQMDLAGSMPSPEEMGRLKTEEPEKYAELSLRHMEMQQRVGQAMAYLDAEYEKRGEDADRRAQEWRASEAQKVVKIFPDLANEATRKQQDGLISSYLGGIGFKSAEIAGMVDSRLYRVVRDAIYGANVRKTGATKIAEARERGLRPPKPGPSARVEPAGVQEQKTQQLVSLRERAKSTGSVEDAAAVFRGMGIE